MTTIYAALAAVMADVQAVSKKSRNESQNFNFRGIDAVMNAVGPALRTHGVIVVPVAEDAHYNTVTVGKNQTPMRECTVRIRYVFYGPDGDSIECVVFGEALDSGDKATNKAHSVAFRTALLQALCIPTDEPDTDANSYVRASGPIADPLSALRIEISNLGATMKWDRERIETDFTEWSHGQFITAADVATLAAYRDYLAELRKAERKTTSTPPDTTQEAEDRASQTAVTFAAETVAITGDQRMPRRQALQLLAGLQAKAAKAKVLRVQVEGPQGPVSLGALLDEAVKSRANHLEEEASA